MPHLLPMKPRKKPPPDHPGNLAGRRRLLREAAWREACGGIRIILGPEGCKSKRPGTYPPPDDVEARFKKILAEKLKALEPGSKPKPKKKKRAKPAGKVSFFTFAKQR